PPWLDVRGPDGLQCSTSGICTAAAPTLQNRVSEGPLPDAGRREGLTVRHGDPLLPLNRDEIRAERRGGRWRMHEARNGHVVDDLRVFAVVEIDQVPKSQQRIAIVTANSTVAVWVPRFRRCTENSIHLDAERDEVELTFALLPAEGFLRTVPQNH